MARTTPVSNTFYNPKGVRAIEVRLYTSKTVHYFHPQMEARYTCIFLSYFSTNYRDFLGEIETDNLTVSNSEIITFDFTVSKNRSLMKEFH